MVDKEGTGLMESLKISRDQNSDLLTRPPLVRSQVGAPWPHPLLDPVRQLEALADLFHRGLLSRDEFERQKQRICSE